MPVIFNPPTHDILAFAVHLVEHEPDPVYGTFGSHVMDIKYVSPHDKVPLLVQ